MKNSLKPSSFALRSRKILSTIIQPVVLGLLLAHAQAGNTWDGGGGDDNWGTGNNWNPNGAPSYGTLVFSGNTQTTNNNNSITAMNQVNWNGTAAWVMNGTSALSLFDNGGTQAKLESLGSGGVTINAPITFAANNGGPPNPFGEINAVSSNITFASGTLTVSGSSVNGIKFFGGAGRDVTFASTVNASGKWMGFTNANGSSVTIATGASVTTGDFYVMNGNTLKLAGGTLTTSAVRLGGDFGNTGNQNQTLGGTLALTPAAGGVSLGSAINTVTGNTSNALLIDSQNTSGTNTLTGSLFLDSDLRTQTASGGTLAFTTGASDIKGRKLTVDGAGTTSISQVLGSSLGAGGTLVKSGNGSLILSNTSNTYTGTNNATLNASGTQIAGGTLGIHGDGSLGLAPAGAYNNIQFTTISGGTLQALASSISLNANRNISIATAAQATFDSNGHTFTINGIVNGSGGSVKKTGLGTVILSNAGNSYTGDTTVSGGTLKLDLGGSIANSANIIVGDTGSSGTILDVTTKTGGLTIGAGQTLKGIGQLDGNTTIANLGIHAPGNSPGLQTFNGNLSYSTGSVLNWELTSNATVTRGIDFDAVDVIGTGVLSIGTGVTSNLVFSSGSVNWNDVFWDSSRSWFVFDNANAPTLSSGTVFDTISVSADSNSAILTDGTFSWGTIGNDVYLNFTPVPEPTGLITGLLCLGVASLRRRRRPAL